MTGRRREKTSFQHIHGATSTIVNVIKALGYDTELDDRNLEGTPKRVARMMTQDLVWSWDKIVRTCELNIKTRFPALCDGLLFQTNIACFGMCPHHMLPVLYHVSLAYIPELQGEDGSPTGVVGLSKPARSARALARRPVLHEEFANDLADHLCDADPGTIDGLKGHYIRQDERDPKLPRLRSRGSAVSVSALHTCMLIRGACQHSAVTSFDVLRGVFFGNTPLIAEFNQKINQNKRPIFTL